MRIREAVPADHARVAEITLDAYRSLPGGRVSDDYERYLADVQTHVDEGGIVLVAEDDTGDIAGTVTLVLEPGGELFEHRWGIDGDSGFRMLAVDPARTGEGFGVALVRECIHRAARAGRERMVITTMGWMQTAYEMYERLGFVRRPDLDQRYSIGVGLAFVLDLDMYRHADQDRAV